MVMHMHARYSHKKCWHAHNYTQNAHLCDICTTTCTIRACTHCFHTQHAGNVSYPHTTNSKRVPNSWAPIATSTKPNTRTQGPPFLSTTLASPSCPSVQNIPVYYLAGNMMKQTHSCKRTHVDASRTHTCLHTKPLHASTLRFSVLLRWLVRRQL